MARKNKNVLLGRKKHRDKIVSPVTNALVAPGKLFVIQLVHLPNCLLCVTEDLYIGTRIKARMICLGIQLLTFTCGKARPMLNPCLRDLHLRGHASAHFCNKAVKVRPAQRTYLPIMSYAAKRNARKQFLCMPDSSLDPQVVLTLSS